MYISLYLLLKLFQSLSLPSHIFFIFNFTTLQNLLEGDWLSAQFYVWECKKFKVFQYLLVSSNKQRIVNWLSQNTF